MQCPQCQHHNNDSAKFCEECGTRFITACPQCGHQVSPTAKFCAECGAALLGKSKLKKQRAKGQDRLASRVQRREPERQEQAPGSQTLDPRLSDPRPSVGERRQLTVLFCDVVGSTELSATLDPEDYHTVVQAYHQLCDTVIHRYGGFVPQHLGDGVLAYFGYPTAHEDDALRAVRTALEIVTALQTQLPSPSQGEGSTSTARAGEGNEQPRLSHPPHPTPLPTGARVLQVRIGIHTGPVVVGEIGGGEKREMLALGETPNLAARIQGQANPNEVLVSAATLRLLRGQIATEDRGQHRLKGLPAPVALYRVLDGSPAQNRLDVVQPSGLTPLVGREEELALLQRRWQQALDREGQVVLLSGEPGIGKSRLVRELRERAEQDHAVRLEFRCSPYYQNSALQPVIDHLQRLLQWKKDDAPQTKLDKLQTTLARYRFPQPDTFPLFAALLSLPHPPDTPPLNMSSQRQKQKTEEALIAWLVEEAERAPLYCAWEDLHWADPSTLELLGRLIGQASTTRLFVLLTSRPEFTPPWGQHGHLSQLTLSRLGKRQAPQMIARVAGNKPLPEEVMQQIVAKTDGVPLFVEELTKMVLESGLLTETYDSYQLNGPLPPLAIPSTLQDSLMARLDRLATTKELAQLGATIGREFSYDLLHALTPVTEPALQHGLQQLVEAELPYQRGTPPQSTYLFKHALIQDTAYQSLLKSRRQQLHQQIAQVMETQFPDTKAVQPELLAHHYTEAGLIPQAIPYWQQAGQNAAQRSANIEAVSQLTQGLELLKTLPETAEHAQRELTLQTTLGPVLIAAKGFASPEVGKTYARARELCREVGESVQLFLVLRGLWAFYNTKAEYQTARELGERALRLAQDIQDPALLMEAHRSLGRTFFDCGEFISARMHLEQAITLYDPRQHRAHAFLYGYDPGVAGLSFLALVLWHLGYPDQALQRSHEALSLAEERGHPFSLAFTLFVSSTLQQHQHDIRATQEKVEPLITLSEEQGFPSFFGWGQVIQAWVLAEQGQREEGITQMRQGMTVWRNTGAEMWQSHSLALLAEAYEKAGQIEQGFTTLAEALTVVDKTGERYYEAELYRLKGELTLQSKASLGQVQDKSQASQSPSEVEQEAEAYFLKAIEIAQKQQAKSLELRAVMSLARLWRQQGKTAEARQMLAEIYGWFTEGFDTKDLQEAKELLDELSH